MGEPEKITYVSVEERREGLRERGISEEVVDDLVEAVGEASSALVDRLGVRDEVDVEAVERALTVGTLEAISGFVDAGVHDEADVRELASEIRENEMELSLIVGRMHRREQDMNPIAAGLHRGKMNDESA